MGLGWGLGWKLGASLVFGLALSVASTVVLLRALQERRLVETEQGRIAVGWLIVEDLAMVLTLVLLPPIAGLLRGGGGILSAAEAGHIAATLGFTFAKVAVFVALMLVVGRQVIPRILHLWPIPARASCFGSRFCLWRWASPMARPSCSASRSL